MKLTQQEIDEAIEIQFQKDLKSLLEVADLYNKSNKMLFENRLSKEEYETLNEGLWEKAKYYMSKLGRYKAGGKILGKGKIDQEAAAKIQTIIDKKGNEMIKTLNASIKEKNPEFPNNEKGQDFLNTVLEISAIYDSIVAATKKDPKEEGFLPVDAANTIIEDLAEYVKKFLDVDLTAAYSVMDSEKEKVDKDTELLTDEVEDIKEDEAEDVRTKLQAKKGEGGDRESIRMGKEGLASNKLPLILTAIGGSLGALGWIAQTDWFKDLVSTTIKSPDTFSEKTVSSVVDKNIKVDPNGWSYTIQNNGFQEATGLKLGPNEPVENLHKAFKYYGGGNEEKGMEVMSKFLNPENQADSIANLKTQFADPANKTVGNIFNVGEKTYGQAGHLFSQYGGAKEAIAKLLYSTIRKQLVKGATTTVVKSGLAKGLMAAAPALTGIGIGLITVGALVKLMRVKGQKQSRAKTLQDLLNSIQPIKGTEQNQPILPQEPKKEGSNEKGGKTDNEQLFNDLSKFFQFVVNNKKQLNVKGGVSGEALKSKETNPCSNFEVGDKLLFGKGNKVSGEFETIGVITDVSDGNVSYKMIKAGAEKAVGTVNTSDCKSLVDGIKKGNLYHQKGKKDKKNENIMKNEMILTEGKFIKDKRTLEYLNKKSRPDKVKRFEEFLTRLEIIRNKVKKMGNTEDKVINNFVKKLKSNPIVATDFVKMFNVPSDNPKGVQSLKGFIDEIFDVIYSGKNKKMVNMVDKMATLGGGNINKMEESYLYEEKGYNADEPNKAFLKDAQDRGSFKKHLNNFIFELMNMFQYMYKLKKEGKLSGGTKKPAETKPEPKQESVKKENTILTEEINKIKSLMFKIS